MTLPDRSEVDYVDLMLLFDRGQVSAEEAAVGSPEAVGEEPPAPGE